LKHKTRTKREYIGRTIGQVVIKGSLKLLTPVRRNMAGLLGGISSTSPTISSLYAEFLSKFWWEG
jgi:hypothetical protein